MSSIIDKATELKTVARETAKQDMLSLRRINWHGNTAMQQRAHRIIKLALILAERSIDRPANIPLIGSLSLEQRETLILAELENAQLIIESGAGPEMRIARLQGFLTGQEERESELNDIESLSTEDAIAKLDEIVGDADAARTFLKDIRKKPKTYYRIAHAFLSGRLGKSVPEAMKAKAGRSAAAARKLSTFLRQKNIEHKKGLERAAKFLGIAQLGLTISAVVFEVLADEGKWAQHLASATVAAGAGAALGAVVTSAAVTSVVTATLTAAGATAEVPPVAAAILATGLVIVGTIAIAALFDSLIDLIFDLGDIPPGMRLSMSTQMYSGTSSKMSADLSASVVLLPG